MTVLAFPSSPIIGQRYNAPNEIQYVFDGVKWIVETVASTSAAVTNSVQDRVAPMFVTGPNTGITFAYNAATNVMNASITALNGDTLVNGSRSFTLEANGTLTLNGAAFSIPTNTNQLTNGAGFITSTALTGLATETYVTSRGYITSNGLPIQTGNANKYLKTDGTTLSWETVAGGGTSSYTPDDTDNWNEPTINTIQAALDELAARVTAFENFEIDGGNAYTPAVGELLIDGYGA
jgi:hypothetical protein